MLKKWLLTGAVVVVLAALGVLAPRWLPWLLDLAGTHSPRIEGLSGLIQIVLWVGATVVFGARLLRPRQPADPPAPVQVQVVQQSGPGEADLRSAYLRSVLEQTGYLSLSGVDPAVAASGDRGARLRLEAVYTALLTLSPALDEPRHQVHLTGEGRVDRLPALAQLNRCDRLVLLGEPGSGKSTFVNFVALCLAGEALGKDDVNLKLLTAPLPSEEGDKKEERAEPQPWAYGALLPVRVVLRDLAARGLPPPGERATAEHLWRFIESVLTEQGHGAFAPFLRRELLTRGGLLLLDGLDEVPEAESRREQIKEMVESFAQARGRCRIVVTSRTYAYQNQGWRLERFPDAVLAPWSYAQIRQFVARWYAHMASLERLSAEDAGARAELLKRAIFASDRILELARRPLLLTLIASLHAWRSGSLPDGREELYSDAVKLLLDFWEMRRHDRSAAGAKLVQPSLAEYLKVEQGKVREILEELAFEAHAAQPAAAGGGGTADVAEGELLSRLLRLRRGAEPADPGRLLEFLKDRAGLLVPRGVKVYTFPHRTFQEYLAACYLTRDDFPDRVADLARRDSGRWREVVLLAGAKAHRGAASNIWSLADALCDRSADDPDCEPEDVWGAFLAGQAVAESARLDAPSPRNTRRLDRLRTWFVRLLGEPLLPPVERALAGRVLARLGDPRQEALTVDAMEFRRVEAGSFQMGSREEAPKGHGEERPQHECEIPYTFEIGRYPVTVAQFREYLDERRCAPRDADSSRVLPNEPVVRVSWEGAADFCDWLSDRWRASGHIEKGQQVRLPSEAEWEKAARGIDGRMFPWGNEEDSNRANCAHSRIFAASTVGCFPGGTSPYGCEEMSGNVWEWTQSVEGKYPYPAFGEERERRESRLMWSERVLRGSSYFSHSRDVRCAARTCSVPSREYDNVGFRVAVSPVSSGH